MTVGDTDRDDLTEAVRVLLEPGEVLQAAGETGVAFGDDGPVSQWQSVTVQAPGWVDRVWAAGTRTTLRKVGFFTLLAPVAVVLALDSVGPSTLVERLLGGRTCQGPRDSTARRVQHALSPLGPGANLMAVTDRRLLLVRRKLFADPPELAPVLSILLAEIAAARHRPRGPLRRRVELRFVDGTRILLALPSFRAPGPRRFLEALPPALRR